VPVDVREPKAAKRSTRGGPCPRRHPIEVISTKPPVDAARPTSTLARLFRAGLEHGVVLDQADGLDPKVEKVVRAPHKPVPTGVSEPARCSAGHRTGDGAEDCLTRRKACRHLTGPDGASGARVTRPCSTRLPGRPLRNGQDLWIGVPRSSSRPPPC
jgi:hypothetical protein